ncbi:MAG: 50S ribosomal protein L32 [Patescibacteria group bacterium]
MVNRMRSTRSHTGNRRAHHALDATRLTVAKDGSAHPRHRALLDGTQYRGRSVMDLGAKRVARRQKAAKRDQQESRTPEEKPAAEEKKS